MAFGVKMARQQSAAEKAMYDQTTLLPKKKLIVVFATLSLTLAITFFDQNGISVTLPTVGRDLKAEDTISWAGTSSLIANTTFQMLYGRLSDIFGRKRVYLAAVGCLALADLLCGLAQNGPMFYVFRGVAGIGGGGVTNLSMIIVSDVVTLEQRGFYQGIIGACIGLGNLIGPFLAAGLTSHVSWRAYFYLLAPLCVVVGCVAAYMLPSNPPKGGIRENARKIDYVGLVSASAAVILVLIPVSGGGSYFRWDSPMVISMLVVGGLLFVFFIIAELRIAQLPMMPMQIFKSLAVSLLMLQSFLIGFVYQVSLYYLPLFLQNARGYTIIESAAFVCALVAFQSTFSVLSGQYTARRKRYGELLWVGFGSWTVGAGLLLLNTRTSSIALIIVPLMIFGAGIGMTLQPTLVALQAHTTKARRAVIISVRNFFRALGGAVGLALGAAVLQAALRSNLPPKYVDLAGSAYYLPKEFSSPEEKEAVLNAYMAASHAVFTLQVPLVGVCFLTSFLVKDEGLEPSDEREAKRKAALEGRTAGTGGGAMEANSAEENELYDLEANEDDSEHESYSDEVRDRTEGHVGQASGEKNAQAAAEEPAAVSA
ncbi:hypothetical protein SEPCBS119000_000933 [Sporothrix epigloea]|uniref:Major facilitator superfamily (MFS) profile domain-containing protein n=1 Tax=Sporothrix epigloea TaxID=1892477 RepID=A0ABP0DAG4_9PEZI